MTGYRYRTPAQMRAEIGTGAIGVGEPVPGVEPVNFIYHKPTDKEDREGYK